MKERLNNDQIAQRIIQTNSDIKRYLNLAPGFKPLPTQPNTKNDYYSIPMSQTMSPRPILRP
ncbi:hypothetical protein [Desulfosporosinus sp.]|uniref:hypothetical protein n=1 Tax=Desulfosporosinus sp. TaxID=157907 RepID=UPI000E7F2C76|nr:hypothetical protein [Desulfosporosinus sp.]MBC2722172.1 hypothetical protein [Desulfosporosinus sp.]MBC2728415.1 hypothetical protein [Desulfosporosinus sp.]HBV85129.1 hypothetical protein [Desulfosporosinus sp.]